MKKRLTRRSVVIGCVAAGVSIAILALLPSSLTGFGPDSITNIERDSSGKITKTIEVQQSGKTLWDWLSLLGVPLSLAFLGLWFQQLQQKRADDEVKEEVLQVYFDRLSALLIDQNLIALAQKVKNAEDSGIKDKEITEQKELLDAAVDVLRARTLSILRRFSKDKERKSSVIQFLIEVEVISKLKLNLSGANLSGADLRYANFNDANLINADLSDTDLSGANLSSAYLSSANLINADLSGADLSGADLSDTDLSGANLINADLSDTDLSGANLGSAYLNIANLSSAYLYSANLSGANLSGADLSGTDLSSANLNDVMEWNKGQLNSAKLCKTRLPAGCELNPDRDCKSILDL